MSMHTGSAEYKRAIRRGINYALLHEEVNYRGSAAVNSNGPDLHTVEG